MPYGSRIEHVCDIIPKAQSCLVDMIIYMMMSSDVDTEADGREI